MFNKYRAIHFVGIGGVGMSGIAEVLHNLGYDVSGSDMKESEAVSRLRNLGIKVYVGHDKDNINGAHVVVISSAVSQDNPEVKEAKLRHIPVIPRAEMLAELGRLKYGILVAGAHGKTTTTSLIATILGDGGLDPTVVIGGRLNSMGTNAKMGQGEYLVAEADESDGSFLKLNPTIAVITNIDREHMDFFKDLEILKHAFLSFMNKIPFYGIAIVCRENEYIRELIPMIQRKILTYGLTEDADIYAKNIRHSETRMIFEVMRKGDSIGEFSVTIPGIHNVLNSLAAIATGIELQIPIGKIREALKGFGGIHRRFEFKGEVSGVRVYDDYGHHPSEIQAVLKAARGCYPARKITVIFQPHRYTRTRDLIDQFALSFGDADSIYLMDIYAAGEKPIEGISSEALINRMRDGGISNVMHISDRQKMLETITASLKNGDILITLGAGDVYRMGEEVLGRLTREI